MSEQTPVPTAPAPAAPGATLPPKKGLAVAALVLGIVAIVGAWIPILNIGSIVIALVGVVLGVIAIVQAVKGKAAGKVMAIVGTSLSALSIVIAIVVNAATVAAVDDALDELDDQSTIGVVDSETDDASGDEATSNVDEEPAADAVGTWDNPGVLGDATVWTVAQGEDSWEITFDSIDIVDAITGDDGQKVAVISGTATPTAISDGPTSNWATFPMIGLMADGAAVDDTYDFADTDFLGADFRSTVDLEATAGTTMNWYTTVGLPAGVVPEIVTVETFFGSDAVYLVTGL
ncbi:DUF4190 domain-containing protein [Demequina sp. SYSU T00039]|uniref:DUF4190 domain-containing protein n=1 Tax=Demequina lignilytica TaxID=3051663 RepID=A0AAW7M4R1_9MICO|nr:MULTISPECIES: DUF4190 domain-containing protein [unclassified Demequina]MDN4477803.1 DUF4190 domain-containing protein [Demequina sp. SYSU T00039-1]MDN4487712.1 DUF4190 domain-containing protein [Demequina sp. SYSU T00039]MDN4490905.1 DUF4190 domain-containing protein [Demequina sp. SYSU T00068]